jgi:hypothetical protein
MSLLNWFSKKILPKYALAYESSGLGHVEATVPYMPAGVTATKVSPSLATASAANRKSERLEHREQLYSVVRGAMTRAGLLSSSYKFKVLSLDPRGRQYLIMMDLVNRYAGEAGRLADIETLIAQSAKARHDILVTAVYWRINEHVTAGLSPPPRAHAPVARPEPTQLPRRASDSPFADQRGPGSHGPLEPHEMAAFKSALAKARADATLAGSGEIVHSGRRIPATPPDFQDTEMLQPEEQVSPLSGTQYGDLE